MLHALVAGSQDPQALAELARGALRKKLPALRAALHGRFGAPHALLVGAMLAKLEFLEGVITALSAEIARVLAPFARAVDLLRTMPGVDHRPAEALVAEIGGEMARFGTAPRLASGAGRCPGNYESAGQQRRGTTRHGSKWLRTSLTEAAKAAGRTTGTYRAAQYARRRGRRGAARATIAVAHSILVAASYILARGPALPGPRRRLLPRPPLAPPSPPPPCAAE